MSVLFANGFAATGFIILTVVFLLATVFFLADSNYVTAFVTGLLTVLFVFSFGWSSTHRVVPANTSAILINRYTGQPSPHTLRPGVVEKAWSEQIFAYPGQTSYQWCPEVTPSVKGGAEISAKVCITMDASQIDWRKQYTSYNGGSDEVLTGWLSASVQSSIAQAVSQFEPSQLTNERVDVETAIYSQLIPWASENGVPVKSVSLLNWQFTSEKLRAQYEAAQVSVAKVDAANNENAAAKIQAQTASERAAACKNAGFTDQGMCLGFLQLQWLQNLSTLPDNFIISLGGTADPAVSFPALAPAPVVPAQ